MHVQFAIVDLRLSYGAFIAVCKNNLAEPQAQGMPQETQKPMLVGTP